MPTVQMLGLLTSWLLGWAGGTESLNVAIHRVIGISFDQLQRG